MSSIQSTSFNIMILSTTSIKIISSGYFTQLEIINNKTYYDAFFCFPTLLAYKKHFQIKYLYYYNIVLDIVFRLHILSQMRKSYKPIHSTIKYCFPHNVVTILYRNPKNVYLWMAFPSYMQIKFCVIWHTCHLL